MDWKEKYDEILGLSERVAIVKKDGCYGLVNIETGEEIISLCTTLKMLQDGIKFRYECKEKYDTIEISGIYALVCKSRGQHVYSGLVNTATREELIPCVYEINENREDFKLKLKEIKDKEINRQLKELEEKEQQRQEIIKKKKELKRKKIKSFVKGVLKMTGALALFFVGSNEMSNLTFVSMYAASVYLTAGAGASFGDFIKCDIEEGKLIEEVNKLIEEENELVNE